ncbi:MAG: class I SAM-dependent methyltransferase [Bacteroidota bacterium]
MRYDPIKNVLGEAVRSRPMFRRLLYRVLGLLFLREWHVKRALRGIFARHPVKAMLDAGSGFGQYSYYCARRFKDVKIKAVDVKNEQIGDCREFFEKAGFSNVDFAVEDLTQPIHTDEFDLILSVDVMEHIADDETVFRNFFRALRGGGLVLVNTPSSFGGSDAHGPDDPGFIEEHARSGYGPEEIRRKLTGAGLAVEEIRFTYGPWGTVSWKLGIKIPMVLLNRSKLFALALPFYYLLTFPFTLLFMYLDYRADNKTGTGLLVTARKP